MNQLSNVIESNSLAALIQLRNAVQLRGGYIFQLFLPNAIGQATPEAATGGANGVAISAPLSELLWSAYAWPSTHNSSGRRAFFTNQSGEILSCQNLTVRYQGSSSTPAPTAAVIAAASNPSMTSTIASNGTGQDGEFWLLVN